jgi:hypothetical protein
MTLAGETRAVNFPLAPGYQENGRNGARLVGLWWKEVRTRRAAAANGKFLSSSSS